MYERSSVAELAAILKQELDRYPVGEKLPSSRELVRRHRVSPVTVSRAIAQLATEGLVVPRPGSGVYRAAPRAGAGPVGDVSWQEVALSAESGTAAGEAGPRSVDASGVLATLTVPPVDVIDLGGGYLHPSLQPERALGAALARAGRRPGTWARPPVEGLTELRAWFARDIGGPGGVLSTSDVLITAGGQNALSTALRSLAAPGAPVLVESPTYPGTLAAARAWGLRPVPVPVDGEGVRTDLLEHAFRSTGSRLFVCQPLFQNPTGVVLSPRRRAEVLRIARAAGAFVVEDDFARRLVHADASAVPSAVPPPLAADSADGVVVHVRSLTKATSPSLRIGALAARGPALERLRATQVVDSLFVPRPLQETALELVGAPSWGRHLRTISEALLERREAAVTALRHHLPGLLPATVPVGGYHLWLKLPPGADEARLGAAAVRAGVAVTPGTAYFAAEPPGPRLRVSYVSAAGTAEIAEGVARLRRAYEGLGLVP
ncbi:PLP-dependent aminotransferase family protein [Streptomyces capparidis]